MADYVKKVFLAPRWPKPPRSWRPLSPNWIRRDGVPDSRDKCPNTPKVPRLMQRLLGAEGVYFDSDKAVIKDTKVLDEATVILKANPKLNGEVRRLHRQAPSFGRVQSEAL